MDSDLHRGIVNGLLISLVCWVLMIGAVRWLLS
jgi:hypothetical protein